MSELVEHAKRELALVGKDNWTTEGIINIVEAFAAMGHSGASAEFTTQALERLLRFQPLSPVTNDPDEWYHHNEKMFPPDGIWQNIRDSRLFSKDGGKTYYNIHEGQLTNDGITQLYTSVEKVTNGG